MQFRVSTRPKRSFLLKNSQFLIFRVTKDKAENRELSLLTCIVREQASIT